METKIAIIGKSGFLGTALKNYLSGYDIVLISGRKLLMDPDSVGKEIEGRAIIINLAGYPVFGRWTQRRKLLIHKSRIELNQRLFEIISRLKKKPGHFICASGIALYSNGTLSDEKSRNLSGNKLADLILNWENAAVKMNTLEVPVTILRLGIVLSRQGGAYKFQRRIIKLGLGGRLGNGKQGLSFILMEDFLRAIEFIIDNKILGIVNIVCPEPVDNKTFVTEIGRRLRRPVLFTVPSALLKLILKEGSLILLEGQKVFPGILIEHKFEFIGNNLKSCLDILEK